MNLELIPFGLTYDDVLLIPRRSRIRSRLDVDLSTRLTRNRDIRLPVVAANMDTVCEGAMARAMAEMGGIGIIHRFMTSRHQADEIARVKDSGPDLLVGAAIGTDRDMLTRMEACVQAGTDVIVLDIAHGHSEHAIAGVQKCKERFPEVDLIAGNVATAEGALDLADAGADAVKVGVGPGGVCITRQVTGVGVPQLTALHNVLQSGIDVPIIADGGIRTAGDIAKALATGADTVMLGSLLAGTKESPGDVEQSSHGLVKRIRGMASREAVEDRAERLREQLDAEYFEMRSPEGVESTVPYKGLVGKIIGNLMGGVKSSFSYLNAENIREFQENAAFIRVSPAGLREGEPHIDAVF